MTFSTEKKSDGALMLSSFILMLDVILKQVQSPVSYLLRTNAYTFHTHHNISIFFIHVAGITRS